MERTQARTYRSSAQITKTTMVAGNDESSSTAFTGRCTLWSSLCSAGDVCAESETSKKQSTVPLCELLNPNLPLFDAPDFTECGGGKFLLLAGSVKIPCRRGRGCGSVRKGIKSGGLEGTLWDCVERTAAEVGGGDRERGQKRGQCT